MRLCKQADKQTRKVMKAIRDSVIEVCPFMKGLLVPKCEYRGGICDEFNPCGYNKKNLVAHANRLIEQMDSAQQQEVYLLTVSKIWR